MIKRQISANKSHWYDSDGSIDPGLFIVFMSGAAPLIVIIVAWIIKGLMVAAAALLSIPLAVVEFALVPYALWRLYKGIVLSKQDQKYYIPQIPEYTQLIRKQKRDDTLSMKLGSKITDLYRGTFLGGLLGFTGKKDKP